VAAAARISPLFAPSKHPKCLVLLCAPSHTGHQTHQVGECGVKISALMAGACSACQGHHVIFWCPSSLFQWLSFTISELCAYGCLSLAGTCALSAEVSDVGLTGPKLPEKLGGFL